MRWISTLIQLVPVLSLFGCATSAPRQQSRTQQDQDSLAKPPISHLPAEVPTVRHTPGTHRYLIISDAVITLNNDTTSRSYTSSRVFLTLMVATPLGDIVGGIIDSVITHHQGAIPTPIDSSPDFPARWSLSAQRDSLRCTPINQLIHQAEQLLLKVPSTPATQWQDTVAGPGCIGGLQIMRTVHRHSELTGPLLFRSDSTFLVTQVATITITSDSTRAPVISGSGTTTSRHYFTPDKTTLLTRIDEGNLEIQLRSGEQLQTLRQELRSQTVPVNRVQ